MNHLPSTENCMSRAPGVMICASVLSYWKIVWSRSLFKTHRFTLRTKQKFHLAKFQWISETFPLISSGSESTFSVCDGLRSCLQNVQKRVLPSVPCCVFAFQLHYYIYIAGNWQQKLGLQKKMFLMLFMFLKVIHVEIWALNMRLKWYVPGYTLWFFFSTPSKCANLT